MLVTLPTWHVFLLWPGQDPLQSYPAILQSLHSRALGGGEPAQALRVRQIQALTLGPLSSHKKGSSQFHYVYQEPRWGGAESGTGRVGNTAPESLTWMGFSMSPSHKDTSGTVNGFHTGSRVYLITWEAGRSRMLTDSLAPIRDGCEKMGKPLAMPPMLEANVAALLVGSTGLGQHRPPPTVSLTN